MVAVKICYASRQPRISEENAVAFCLDPQILARGGGLQAGDGFVRRSRKGGERRMKYFKITKTWAVKAESEAEAVKLVAANPAEYLDSETVTRTEYKKPAPKTGWGNAITGQLLGASSKR
jgi:hypothetical protein